MAHRMATPLKHRWSIGNNYLAGITTGDWIRLLRENHFADVAQGFPIVVRFGTRAQRRFGSITSRNGVSYIMVNLLYANP